MPLCHSFLGRQVTLINRSALPAWVADGCVGRAPAPGEMVVFTSDGSFHKWLRQYGMGSRGQPRRYQYPFASRAVSLGVSLATSLPLSVISPKNPDTETAYSAEVAGLCWSALAALQLAIACPVLFPIRLHVSYGRGPGSRRHAGRQPMSSRSVACMQQLLRQRQRLFDTST